MTPTKSPVSTTYFEQFYLGCLAHASYMIGANGEAAVVDPQRDVEIYLESAAAQGLTIRHIFETHLHADFVSGHKELAERTGAQIYIGARAQAKFPHVALTDGFELKFGHVRIQALETPGHTPESTCLLLFDEEKRPAPWAVLTGDTLFLGDVGRPDLSATHTPVELAGLLYESLHQKLMTLPDDVLVYPAHGAGSLCGKNMRAERSSTIGTERLTNYALQISTQEEFVRQLTSNLPTRPEYFAQDAEINRAGAASLSQLPKPKELTPQEVVTLIDQGVVALDVRPGDVFAEAHVPRSVNIALSGQFATWAGTLLGLEAGPVLIADTVEQIEEARLRLARVGIDVERGYLAGGIESWKQAGLPLSKISQIDVEQLRTRIDQEALLVLDVRREGEWSAGHLAGAVWHPLDKFHSQPPSLGAEVPVAVHCKSGYRSMAACSLLLRAGMRNVVNVAGGYDSWEAAGFPVVRLPQK
jgi:glyoxylase-like metal-dependent hydrolase (beta-lactamase superfamily II)/rhodanese-related sulfurtransferase